MSLSDLPQLQGQTILTKDAGSLKSLQISDGFDVSAHNLLSNRDDQSEGQDVVYPFGENDAEEAVKCLRKTFQVLNPGYHIAKRTPEHGSINFIHCKHAPVLGRRYLQLRQLMEERARIEILRDCLSRIKLAAAFVKDLEGLTLAEYRILYAITHDCMSDIPLSKLCCLNALCEDLRAQIGHWNCIKQKLHTNRWLQPILGSLYIQLDHVRHTLNQLRDRAIWWLDRLISVGFEVFAHGNVECVTHEMLWNITRGLEDFNSIVNGLKNATQTATSKSHRGKLGRSASSVFDPILTNAMSNVGENVRAIPFTRVLNTLANERSKYAALETHKFFTTNEEFLKVLYSGRLPNYSWSDESRSVDRQQGPGQSTDTSDYHTATGSMTSLSAAVLKVGSIRAPDLSNLMSPLVDVARKEHTFAENFLLIVCNSTNLLRKNDNQSKSRRTVKLPQSPAAAKPPRGHTSERGVAENPVLSRSDSLRKSVSWGDSADSSIRSQLTSRYMAMYWEHFGSNLYEMFHEPCWGPQKSLYQCQLGSLGVFNTTVIAIIRHMMEHVCLKGPLDIARLTQDEALLQLTAPHLLPGESREALDLFPNGCISPMLTAVRKCLHCAAFGAWDTCLCNALASHLSDKCYPCPLVNGEYSTRTGMLLRDTYQPMLGLLREQLADLGEAAKGSNLTSTKSQPDVCQAIAVATRLAATSGIAFNWCSTKTHQFLTNMSVSNFLLISQTDLKLLSDETQASVYLIQMFGKAVTQKNAPSTNDHLIACLCQVTQHLTSCSDKLQSLPGSCMKHFSTACYNAALEYFKQTMPPAKVWRRKSTPELPAEHNLYMEHTLESVLEPVLEAVSKLSQSVQLSVISMATAAICEGLTSFILKEKIKFSYHGAHQLGVDVTYMKHWLRQGIANESVQQSVLDLSALKYLNGVVILLKRQPAKRPPSRFRDPCSAESGKESLGDTYIQGDRMDTLSEDDINHVSNAQDWLSLRLQGGGRGWKISSCFNPDT